MHDELLDELTSRFKASQMSATTAARVEVDIERAIDFQAPWVRR